MSDTELLDASRREQALYAELLGAYRALAEGLAGADGEVDAAWLADHDARAEATSTALRALAAALAPARLTGAAVGDDVRTLWAESARLALAAARANAEVTALVGTRRARLLARLGRLGSGRRVLEAYRPSLDRSAAVTTRRV